MKICPRCEKTYPDTEAFCQTDGSALVEKGPVFAEQSSKTGPGGDGIECPVCGGKAEPGEVICNFCGTRLTSEDETTEPSRPSQTASRSGTQVHREPGGGTGSTSGGNRPRRTWAVIGYVCAAVLALIGGVYLALHLSPSEPTKVATAPAPSAVATPAEAAAGPIVALATNPALQVVSPTGQAAPERDLATARSKFEDGKPALLDAYRAVLSGSPGVSDGMMVRIQVLPDGTVNHVAVRTSTSLNPELDAKVVKSVSGWKFATSPAPKVKIDYPMIFAPTPADRAKIESALQTKMAGLSPSEAPEYAYSPPMPTAVVSPTPKVAAAPTPAPAPKVAKERPARRVAPRHATRERLAAIPKPTPSLLDRVQRALKSNRKLRRAHAYTAGSTVTLYGTVFDNNDKYLAERVVKRVPGVTAVVNTLTTDTAKWAAEQATIKRQLQNAGLPNVTVKVIGNDAYLGGTVKTKLERVRAATIAESAAPVTVRSNLIRVEPGRVFGF